MTDIYSMAAELREHENCVYATVFTWDDVKDRMEFLKQDDVEFAEDFDPKSLQSRFSKAIEHAIMYGGEWSEAVDDILLNNALKIPWRTE